LDCRVYSIHARISDSTPLAMEIPIINSVAEDQQRKIEDYKGHS
jgi:hypothetical protein